MDNIPKQRLLTFTVPITMAAAPVPAQLKVWSLLTLNGWLCVFRYGRSASFFPFQTPCPCILMKNTSSLDCLALVLVNLPLEVWSGIKTRTSTTWRKIPGPFPFLAVPSLSLHGVGLSYATLCIMVPPERVQWPDFVPLLSPHHQLVAIQLQTPVSFASPPLTPPVPSILSIPAITMIETIHHLCRQRQSSSRSIPLRYQSFCRILNCKLQANQRRESRERRFIRLYPIQRTKPRCVPKIRHHLPIRFWWPRFNPHQNPIIQTIRQIHDQKVLKKIWPPWSLTSPRNWEIRDQTSIPPRQRRWWRSTSCRRKRWIR